MTATLRSPWRFLVAVLAGLLGLLALLVLGEQSSDLAGGVVGLVIGVGAAWIVFRWCGNGVLVSPDAIVVRDQLKVRRYPRDVAGVGVVELPDGLFLSLLGVRSCAPALVMRDGSQVALLCLAGYSRKSKLNARVRSEIEELRGLLVG